MVFGDFEFDYEFDCALPGVKWSARAYPDKLTRHMMFEGTYQHEVIVAIQSLLRPGDVFFDVGAHHGLMSVVAAKAAGPTGRVVAFEPNPEARYHLERHLALNTVSNVTVEPIGILDREGTLDFYQQRGARTYNSSFVREFVDEDEMLQPIHVPVTTLDRYVQATGVIPSFLKIDVEGTDMHALKSGLNTIEKHSPVLSIEFNEQSATAAGTSVGELYDRLVHLGYGMTVLEKAWDGKLSFSRQRAFDLNRDLSRTEVTNVLCTPAHRR